MHIRTNVRVIRNSLWSSLGYHRGSLVSRNRQSYAIFVCRPPLPGPPLEQIVHFKTQATTNAATSEATDINTGAQSSVAESIASVSNLLGLGLGKTKSLFKKLPGYGTTPIDTLKKRHNLLVQQGISEERLKKLPHLLLKNPG